MKKPRVSFIIPIPPGGECDKSLDSIFAQNYDRSRIEVLVTIGRHRSIQRNEAINLAGGEFIFFLDNDVDIPHPDYIDRHLEIYGQDKKIASIGGPSLTPATDSLLQKAFGEVFASFLGTQAVRARYARLGRRRDSNEKELILCNQSMRSAPLKKLGGFNVRFHSGNEENELINRLGQAGNRLIYDPDLYVYRSQRRTLKQFISQIAKYGKSRVEHFLIRPGSFETVFLIPLFFLFYLIALPFALLLPLAGFPPPEFALPFRLTALTPLFLYLMLTALFAGQTLARTRMLRVALLTFALFPLHHCSYALGNLYVLFRRFVPESRKVPPPLVRKYALHQWSAAAIKKDLARRGAPTHNE